MQTKNSHLWILLFFSIYISVLLYIMSIQIKYATVINKRWVEAEESSINILLVQINKTTMKQQKKIKFKYSIH